MTLSTTLAAHRTARRALTTSIAVAAAGLLLAPSAAFAAGGPSGPGGGKPDGPSAPKPPSSGPSAPKPPSSGPSAPKPPSSGPASPKPSNGPVRTVTKVSAPKAPKAAKALTISARVSPARRGPGTKAKAKAETGTVVFTVDGTASAPVRVAANKASEKVKLAAGEHTISAKYSGDSAHAPSDSGPVDITVD
jgi:hypothetical protein